MSVLCRNSIYILAEVGPESLTAEGYTLTDRWACLPVLPSAVARHPPRASKMAGKHLCVQVGAGVAVQLHPVYTITGMWTSPIPCEVGYQLWVSWQTSPGRRAYPVSPFNQYFITTPPLQHVILVPNTLKKRKENACKKHACIQTSLNTNIWH